MKKEIFIYHHMGLGDHITCHGIVRHYCSLYEQVYLFVKPQNYNNVQYMYNDLRNLMLLVADDNQAMQIIWSNNLKNVLYIGSLSEKGWTPERTDQYAGNFEEQFYKHADIPFSFKTEKFYINRDMKKEMDLFNSLNLKEGEYIFTHGTGLNEDYFLDKSLRRISPDSHGFFDWIYVIENAKEIHCMDSSYLCLIDCLNIDKKIPLFNHRYVRNYPEYIKIGSDKWNFINDK